MQGPATWELLTIFQERWSEHAGAGVLELYKPPLRTVTPIGPLPGAHHWVQVGRTYPNGTAHVGIYGLPPNLRGYSFAPFGEQTAGRMIIKGIMEARKFIYVEDQYFVDTETNQSLLYLNVRQALIQALQRPEFQHLTVLIPHSSQVKDQGFPYRRSLLINALKAAGGNKVRIANLKEPVLSGFHTYVHDKVWIFDDQFAIIGSANCNRRSFTNDSEVVAAFCDQEGEGTIRTWIPHLLRMRLWSEHLGVPREWVRDPVATRDLWLIPPAASRIERYNAAINLTPPNALLWDTVYDPDGK
jgi:phosphatidylserine/phosphatidylglycerophosphate/cardiolipin synthase-like enzyme